MTTAILEFEPKLDLVPREIKIRVFRKMLTALYVEERMKTFSKQGKCTFAASTRGHEATQIGITELLKPGCDWFFPYYRSRGTVIGLGMPLEDLFSGMLNREGDPNSAGRNMPEHFSSRRLHLVSQTACTGSQYLPAVGAARAMRADGGRPVGLRRVGRRRDQRGRIL